MKNQNQLKAIGLVPKGFSRYEVKNGKIFNVSNGNEILLRDNGKYQIKNDDGIKKNLSMSKIIELLPKSKSKRTSFEKPSVDVRSLMVKDDVKKIMNNGDMKKNRKIYELHKKGYKTHEIMAITGSNYGVVKRDIWRYETGKTKL
jgi:hypothetical protein